MNKIMLVAALLIATCISLDVPAQANALMQKLPRLSDTELTAIENKLPPSMLREAATRTPGQFNVLLLSGQNKASKLNAARYLAQRVNADIYRVDLSQVISKNIQETEKNILLVFEAAKNKNWVLFFDEGEALFGRRHPVKDSHDRYDNQEIAYFLYQIKQYRGSVIISITVENNINPMIFEKFVRMPLPR